MDEKDDKLIFGAAYYEEYLSTRRVDKDMELMEKAGINTIRIGESTWSVTEPSYGVYDFSHITSVIEAAAARNIRVIVGTPTYAIPGWLAKLSPGILDGNSFGPRQNFDLTDPVYRRCAEKIIRETVARTAGYPNVIGYQLDNETKHYGVKSERVLSSFRKWMKNRFPDIAAFNAAYGMNYWSNSAVSFEELPDPTASACPGYACAFETYRRGLAADFLKWQAKLVSELKREDQFITHNFDFDWEPLEPTGKQGGYSEGIQPDMDQFTAAKSLTLVGTDVYCPCADSLTGREIAFAGDVMRPLAGGGNYLVLESQAQGCTGWLPYPGQLRLMAFSHIAAGASGVMYWPWISLPAGLETFWKGVLSHDGTPGITYREVQRLGRELARLSPKLSGLRKSNRIAIVVSQEALHALRHFPTSGRDGGYNDLVNRLHGALYELNLECDVIDLREPDWSGYRLLIFPQLYCASGETLERVRRYVQQGGTLLATYRSFFADENLLVRPDAQPFGLTELFGMRYTRFTRGEDGSWMELLEPERATPAGRYSHRYWEGVPAATRNRWGKGCAWYLGTELSGEDLKDFLVRVCESAGIQRPSLRWPVICRSATAADGSALTFVFNYSAEPRSVPSPVEGTDLITGEPYTKRAPIGLADWGAAILQAGKVTGN